MEQATLSPPRIKDYFYFLIVGAYLTLVMLFLLITGKLDPGVSFRRIIKGFFTRRAKGTLENIHEESGFCYVCTIDPAPISDADGRSRIKLYEDGRLLERAHTAHEEIRESGKGRFSHWGTNIYFSTSDNTNPNTNGRIYTFRE